MSVLVAGRTIDNTSIEDAERRAPEGARMELRVSFRSVTTPGVTVAGFQLQPGVLVSGATIANTVAYLANASSEVGHLTLWPGAKSLATASGSTVSFRWVKGSIGSPTVLAILSGVGAMALYLLTAGVSVPAFITASALGLIVAVGVYALAMGYQLVDYIVHHPSQVAVPLLELLGIGALAVLAIYEIANG